MKFFVATFITAATTLAAGHAALTFPVSRNVAHSNVGNHYGASGSGICGGTGGQWDGANMARSNKRDTEYMSPKEVLLSGQIVEIEIETSASHGGAMVLELCTHPEEEITLDCFVRLQRDPNDLRGGQYFHEYPEYFFPTAHGCSKITRQRFLLPDNIESQHAILRWAWATGNSNTARHFMKPGNPLFKGIDLTNFEFEHTPGNFCKINFVSGPDAQPGGDLECPLNECQGEHFYNCADVSIEKFDSEPYSLVVSKQGTTERGTATTQYRYEGWEAPVGPVVTEPASGHTGDTTTKMVTKFGCISTTSRPVVAITQPGDTTSNEIIAACKDGIKGKRSWDTEACKGFCDASVDNAWCVARKAAPGLDCVVEQWVNVCELL